MSLVILNEMGPRAEAAIRSAVPDAEVVAVGPEPPESGTRADVFFGGYGPHSLAYAACVAWVQLPGTGVDKVPAEMYEGRIVTCARGASSVAISEFVLAAILAFEKHIPEVWLDEPPEHWNFGDLGGLNGKTLGLVGLGGIGAAIAARALPFGMRVRAVRRTDTPSPIDAVEVLTDRRELFATADHLVLAVPATGRTRHLIDADAFAAMKPGVHLVNIARGSLVDQDALRVALDDGRVARATLDTVEPEPLPAGHWLYEHANVRLSAHVSWVSPVGFEPALAIFVENLRRYVRGEALVGVVDRDAGY
ncbi:MAG TPA: NAD(P)-dependent oxidoreductase [Acidimicrobiia bacterium]|nr:NAD(P)-dependent oxidoreductase [Acidimicrobiia bacterium]